MNLDEHWMATVGSADRPVPVTVLERWRWYKRGSRRERRRYGVVEIVAIVTSAVIPVAAAR